MLQIVEKRKDADDKAVTEMKILHTVEFYHPSVGGMQEVVRQLSERLAQLGHDITVATTRLPERANWQQAQLNGVTIKEFDVSGNLATGMSGDVTRYQDFLRNSDFDIIVNFAAQQWATDAMLPILDAITAKKVFVPTGFSGLYARAYRKYFAGMSTWMQQYDMNIFLSDNYRDINFARDHGIAKTVLIPNGAARDEFLAEGNINVRSELGIPADDLMILHVGSHTGKKGHKEAIEIFCNADLSHATFVIVGNHFADGCAEECHSTADHMNRSKQFTSKDKTLLVVDLCREATVAAYKEADIFLFPSNIECSPIVLFECMASRTPFISTDVGNAREIAAWSQSGLIMPTLQYQLKKGVIGTIKNGVKELKYKFARQRNGNYLRYADVKSAARMLEKMAYDKNGMRTMAQSGFDAWQKKFSWEVITQEYERLYYSLTGKLP